MHFANLQKVTIVAERLLQARLLKMLDEEGATGYTMLAAEGRGSRGVNAADFEGRHLQLETIVPPEVGRRILERIADELLEDYAVIVYLSDVSVLRRHKFDEADGEASPGPEEPG